MKVGYVPGGFDMFHVGHLNILQRAREGCDYLIAGVVTAEVIEKVKGKTPIVPQMERMEIVGNVGVVDEVVSDNSVDKFLVWEALHFDVFFKGDDWKGTPRGMMLEKKFAKVGVGVVYFPYTKHTSSTLLRQLIGAQID